MTEDIGKDIASKIGRIDKPLRRGGYVKNDEGERIWVDFRYERLPIFYYKCGLLGHDEKHCQASSLEQSLGRQYGEWLKAGGVIKVGDGKEKLKEQFVHEKWCLASMVVDGGAGEACGAENRSLPELVVGGGAEEESGTVMMIEEAPLNMAKSPVMSYHRKQGEQVRWEERVPEASNSELERATRAGLNGDRTNLVKNEGHGTEAVNK
nr:hypothetical protein CFP56_06705 [Quercus suber]